MLIGEANVGKTAICMNFADNHFSERYFSFKSSYCPTIGIDFKLVNKLLDGMIYKLQIWDLAGI